MLTGTGLDSATRSLVALVLAPPLATKETHLHS